MFPIVAVILSALFEGMEVKTHIVAGAGIALAGNLVILGGRLRKAGASVSIADSSSAIAETIPSARGESRSPA
jgi:drug/metabolite transporter (DMT)-like permease